MKSNDILKFDLTKKILFSLLTFLLIILGLIYLIIVPTVKAIKKMGEEIEAQRIDLEKKYIKGQNLKQLSENLQKIEPQLAKLDQIFINQNRELEFITTLEQAAYQNKITQKINLDATQNIPGQVYQKMPLQLFTQGSFLGQINYLIGLEALNYYININSLELSSAPGQPALSQPAENKEEADQGNINMLISADTYWK